jgi:hypothetical protein
VELPPTSPAVARSRASGGRSERQQAETRTGFTGRSLKLRLHGTSRAGRPNSGLGLPKAESPGAVGGSCHAFFLLPLVSMM